MTVVTAREGLDLVHGDLTSEIIGAFYDVYNRLGYGFVESVYQHALPQATFRRMFLSSPQEGSVLSGPDPSKSAVLL